MKSWFQGPSGRYLVTMLIWLVLYGVALVVSLKWLRAGAESPAKYSVAILPVLPALGMLQAVVRRCQAMDEMELRLEFEALAFAFAAIAALASSLP